VWGPILLIVAAALFHAAARGVRVALPALFVFTLADFASYGVTLWWSDPPQTLAQYLASVPAPPSTAPERLTTGYGMRIQRTADGSAHYLEATRLIVHDAPGRRLLRSRSCAGSRLLRAQVLRLPALRS
jgi:hypothetical protein